VQHMLAQYMLWSGVCPFICPPA